MIFLETLIQNYPANNSYEIISSDPNIAALALPPTFKLHFFEPLAEFYAAEVLGAHFAEIFIVLPEAKPRAAAYEIVRKYAKTTPITMFCESRLDFNAAMREDSRLNVVSSSFVSARTLVNNVPNIPLVARGLGLNKGEIMQIGVPVFSAYCHISVGSIAQKGFRIAGIYRQNSFFLAKKSTIIQPNDSILVVGDPSILGNLYQKITSHKSHFPAPFGADIHAYIDFRSSSEREANDLINDALFLHKKIQNERLIIHILNPQNVAKIAEIRGLARREIEVDVDFFGDSLESKLKADSAQKMGLIIIAPSVLRVKKNCRALFSANAPILKIGAISRLKTATTALLLCHETPQIQRISYALNDLSAQLNLAILLCEFEPDSAPSPAQNAAPNPARSPAHESEIAQHYQSIARIFGRKITIERENRFNPLFSQRLFFHNRGAFLQFLPLENALKKSRIFWLLEKNLSYLSLLNDANPQILLPS